MNYLGLLCKVRGGQNRPEDRFELKDPGIMGYWDELEIFRCANGCQTLATKMAEEIKKIGGKDAIVYGTAVTKIKIRQNDVQLLTRNVKWPSEKLGNVRPSSTHDYVILAIPPSVWDGVDIRDFHNNKLDLKIQIGDMGMGPAVKFFSFMKKRFWITLMVKVKLPNGKDVLLGSAPNGGTLKLGQVWEGTDNQMSNPGQDIVLSVFAGPTRADPKGARVPNQAEMMAELSKLYPGKDGYDANLLRQRRPHYQDWPSEPFIKTGYWTPKPGEILKVCPNLNKPFHKWLYFAGEHTYLSHFGYMEGALRSGIRAANSVMSAYCGRTDYSPCPDPRQPVFMA